MSKSEDVQLSKKLSWLLRHGAVKEGLNIQPNGYISVSDILQHKNYARHYTLANIERIVALDKKQRYSLRKNPANGSYEIRANQGHSLDAVRAEECLQRISNASEIPLAVHGTYYRHWSQICAKGLSCMTRTHIHFAMQDSCSKEGFVSGFRSDCEILIYLDVQKALEGGMQVYRSSNNVILCAGIDGHIAKAFFDKVIDRRTGNLLLF